MSLTAVDPPQGKSGTRALNRGGRFPRIQLVPPQGIGGAVGPPVGFKTVEVKLPASGDSSYSFYEICQIKKGMIPTIAETVDYPLPVRGEFGPGVFFLNNDDLDNARFTGTDKSTHETTTTPVCIRFSPDGLFMFVLSEDDEKIFRYQLTEAFKPATARFTGNENDLFANFGIDRPLAFQFAENGKTLFISDADFNNIRQFFLSTAFDLSTMVDSTFSFTDGDTPEQFAFSEDGLTMLVFVSNGTIIKEYSLTIPFDFFVAPTDTTRTFAPGFRPVDLAFTNNGKFMNLVEDSTEDITRYFLGTPYTLVTAPVLEDLFTVTNGTADVESIAFNPSGSEMFVLRDNDDIELYELDKDVNILEARYTGFFFDSTAEEPLGPTGGRFSSDGLFYFIAGNSDFFFRYPLTKPFDLTSAGATDQTFGFNNPSGFVFSNDGMKLFVASNQQDRFFQYSLTAPFDISSPTEIHNVRVNSSLNQIRDIKFSNDGLLLFLGAASGNSKIQRFSLTNPFDITDITDNPTPDQTLSSVDTNNFEFADKGRTLLVNLPNQPTTFLRQYRLDTPYDLTTTVIINEIDLDTLANVGTSMQVIEDRNKLFITTVVNAPMGTLEFDLNEKFSPYITEPTQQELDVSLDGITVDGVETSNDGTMVFILDNSSKKIRQYDLSTAFDLRTATLSLIERTITEDNGLRNFRFSADGRHLYFIGNQNDTVFEYTWSTPYDIGTAPTVRSLDISSETVDPLAVEISFDGGELYVITNASQQIFEYELPTNFNVSSGNYTGRTITVSAFGATLSDLKISDDGTNMIILDQINNDILHFALTTPLEIDTLIYSDNSFSVGGTTSTGFAFSSGADIMYCADISTNIITKFEFVPEFLLDTAKENSTTFNDLTAGAPTGLTHSPDGLKIFSLDQSGGAVREFDLITPFTPKTAVFSGNFFNSGGGTRRGIAFSRDGLKLFITSASADVVFQYSMNAPFDLSVNPTLDGSFDVSSEDTDITSVNFSTDGLRMFITGNATDRIYQYDLTDAFNIISTAPVFNGISLDVSNETSAPFDSVFTSDGNEIFVLNESNAKVLSYDVPFPFDLTLASFSGKILDVSTEESSPRAIDISEDGLKLFVTGEQNEVILTYDLSPANDFSRASFNDTTLDIAPQDLDPSAIEFSDDGKKLLVLGHDTDKIFQYDLSEEFILKTAVFSGRTFSVFPQDQQMRGMTFSPDGTVMYTTGRSDFIYQYRLTTPFEIETAYYTDVRFDVQGLVGSNNVTGIEISDDGLVILIAGKTGGAIHQIDLSIAFDLSSASDPGVFINPDESTTRGIQFSNDGTQLFTIGSDNNTIEIFDLPTPFRINVANISSITFDVSAQETNSHDLTFDKDGLRLYVSGKASKDISEYRLDKSIDIKIYDLEGTTQLDFENVFINPGTGDYEIIVKLPELKDLEGIQVLAGKQFADDLSDPATVWSAAQYKSVKHLVEFNGDTVKDSKLTEDGEVFGDILQTTGAVGNALAFNRTVLDGYIDEVESLFYPDSDDARTISIWISLLDVQDENTAMTYGFIDASNEEFSLRGLAQAFNGDAQLDLGTGQITEDGILLPYGSWHKLTGRIDPGETNKGEFFVDGVKITGGLTVVDTIRNVSYIGRDLQGTQHFIGSLKGKIVEDIAKIDEQIKIDFDAENDPDAFFTRTGKFQPGKIVLLADDTGALIEVELQG